MPPPSHCTVCWNRVLRGHCFFQASLWLRVDKVLQKLTKSYKSELRHFLQCCILIPKKCPCKNPYHHTVPPPRICQNLETKSVLSIVPPPLNCQTFHRLWFELKNNISSAILAILSTHYYGAGLLIIWNWMDHILTYHFYRFILDISYILKLE